MDTYQQPKRRWRSSRPAAILLLAIAISSVVLCIIISNNPNPNTNQFQHEHRSHRLTSEFLDPKTIIDKRPPDQQPSLIFVSEHPTYGSAHMRGDQVLNEWKRKNSVNNVPGLFAFPFDNAHEGHGETEGNVAQCADTKSDICADICIYIGPCASDSFPRNSCCRIKILDIIDKYLFDKRKIDKHLHQYNALVVNSSYMKRYFEKTMKFKGEIKVLLHHSDPRWTLTQTVPRLPDDNTQQQQLQFGYVGTLYVLESQPNFVHHKELLPKYPISMIDTNQGILPSVVDFEMDISIRPPNHKFSLFKTTAKVATAAALGHNIITTWDEAVKDALPSDYPFAIPNGNDLKSIENMFNLAMEDYAGEKVLWNKGLEMLKEVNRTLSIDYLAAEYESWLVGLVEQRFAAAS